MADINDAAGRDAVAALRSSHPDAAIDVLQLDLGSLTDVRAFAQVFSTREPKLDILVNNLLKHHS